MEKFTNEFFNNLLSNATSINEAIQIMRKIQDEIEENEGREKAEQFGEKFNAFILRNWNASTKPSQIEHTQVIKSDSQHILNIPDSTSFPSKQITKEVPKKKKLAYFSTNLSEKSNINLNDYSELLSHQYGEMDVAELFGILYKDKMHFVPEKKVYYIFDGKKWIPDIEHIKVKTYAKDFIKSVLSYILENQKENTEDIFYYNSYLGWKKRASLIEDCKTVYPISIQDFDASTHLFNCQNGTLRLDTNKFYEHNPADLLSQISNVEYRENASCEKWEKFIFEIMDGDSTCIEFLQMICGLFLTSYTDEDCFFLFYGVGGRNGKSTLCDTLLYLMGDYAKTAKSSSITKKTGNNLTGPNEDLARLRGCRLLSIASSDEELNLDATLIKSLSKHDTITARFPYQDSFKYHPEFKIIISTNYLPRINDSRIFASNNMILLPFPVHFPLGDEDPSLKEFFCQPENLSGIFNWCLEGLEKYMTLRHTSSQGLKYYLPKKVKERIEECKQEQDFSLVATFIKKNLVKNEDETISAKEVFRSYSKWCREKDYARCNYRNFIKELRKQKTLTRRSEGFVILGYTCTQQENINSTEN
ncbi:MAG: phage/plasmid primase, P4 family [Lachnospiraceae bacterium]